MRDRFLFFSIGGIVAGILTLGLFVFGVLPEARSLQGLFEARALSEADLQAAKAEFTRLKDTVARLAGLGEREGRLQAMLPAKDDIPNVIQSLETMANESGVVLERVEPGAAETRRLDGEVIRTLSFGLSLRGSYSGFKTFLERLESNLRLADLLALSFVTSPENSPTAAYQYTARIRLYTAPE